MWKKYALGIAAVALVIAGYNFAKARFAPFLP